ncbi:MAG: tetratricopeptide repeat protein [Cyanobacteria bacterium SZAS LIN-3]|nr:tetratricopeptide repeat protein [Cyanobacteria bacterium SZAS LIN-3]
MISISDLSRRLLAPILSGASALVVLGCAVGPTLAAPRNPDVEVAEILNRAADLQDHSAHRAAVASCDRALRLRPNSAQAFDIRGKSLVWLGHTTAGLQDINRAIKLDPEVYMYYRDRAYAYVDLKQLQLAIDDLARAQLCKKKPEAHEVANNMRMRAELLTQVHKYKDALVDYDRALKLEPRMADNWISRGHTYFQMGEYQKAVDDYTAAIKIAPKDLRVYGYRAGAYKKLGMKAQAAADLKMTDAGALDF